VQINSCSKVFAEDLATLVPCPPHIHHPLLLTDFSVSWYKSSRMSYLAGTQITRFSQVPAASSSALVRRDHPAVVSSHWCYFLPDVWEGFRLESIAMDKRESSFLTPYLSEST